MTHSGHLAAQAPPVVSLVTDVGSITCPGRCAKPRYYFKGEQKSFGIIQLDYPPHKGRYEFTPSHDQWLHMGDILSMREMNEQVQYQWKEGDPITLFRKPGPKDERARLVATIPGKKRTVAGDRSEVPYLNPRSKNLVWPHDGRIKKQPYGQDTGFDAIIMGGMKCVYIRVDNDWICYAPDGKEERKDASPSVANTNVLIAEQYVSDIPIEIMTADRTEEEGGGILRKTLTINMVKPITVIEQDPVSLQSVVLAGGNHLVFDRHRMSIAIRSSEVEEEEKAVIDEPYGGRVRSQHTGGIAPRIGGGGGHNPPPKVQNPKDYVTQQYGHEAYANRYLFSGDLERINYQRDDASYGGSGTARDFIQLKPNVDYHDRSKVFGYEGHTTPSIDYMLLSVAFVVFMAICCCVVIAVSFTSGYVTKWWLNKKRKTQLEDETV